MDKVFFLVDMNAFFISCEEARDESLVGKPAAVAGDPKYRTGIILTSNYSARESGVRTAMTIYEAKKLCPNLILVKPDHQYYQDISNKIMIILAEYAPSIEQNSIDEAWIDMTTLDRFYRKSYYEVALDIQNKIYQKTKIQCSIGIGFNRFTSKMAAEFKKPMGIFRIDKENYKQYLWKLDINKMYGCGKKTSKKLYDMNVKTIGDLARYDFLSLKKRLGLVGEVLYLRSHGLGGVDVGAKKEKAKSISREKTLNHDIITKEDILLQIRDLIEDVSKKIRRDKYVFETVFLTIKFADFTKITRQKKVTQSNSYFVIEKTIKDIIYELNDLEPIRLIGIGVTNILDDQYRQLSLFEDEDGDKVLNIIDGINKKYGRDIISRGLNMKEEE